MLATESMKFVNAIPPGVIKDDAAYTGNVIDTAVAGGARALVVVVSLGAIDASLATLKVEQSDTKSSATALGGTITTLVDVNGGLAAAPGADDDNKLVIVIVDLRQPHDRYLLLSAKAGDGAAGTYLSALAYFENVGVPDADLGALGVVRG